MAQQVRVDAVEMFPLLDAEAGELHVCAMCGAVVPAGKRDEHMRFHTVAGGTLPS